MRPEGPKKFFWETVSPPPNLRVWMTAAPPYLRVWMTAPPPLSEGLDPQLVKEKHAS